MVAEQIVVKLTADAAQFQSGMTLASQTTGKLGHAVNTLKSGMVGLALQATGTAGPVGKLSQGLLLFAGGSTLILGVAAGIGALSLVYQALTADTRATEQAQKDLIKTLQGMGTHAKLIAAQIELGRLQGLQGKPETLGQVGQRFLSDLTAGRLGAGATEQREAVQRAIAAQLTIISGLTQEVAKWEKGIADAGLDAARQEANRVESLKEGLGVLQRMKAVAESPGFTKTRTGLEVFKTLETKDIAFKGGQSELEEALHRLGLSAGKQFALGMISGIQSMQDVMKSIIIQFLSLGLDALFGGFGGLFGGAFSSGGGSSKSLSGLGKANAQIAPASFSLDVPMGLSAPTTPFAVMRDAEWQKLLRGSLIVAQTAGFRRG